MKRPVAFALLLVAVLPVSSARSETSEGDVQNERGPKTSQATRYDWNLRHGSVVPGSIRSSVRVSEYGQDGEVVITDDGAGRLRFQGVDGSGLVDYGTGAMQVQFGDSPPAGQWFTSYRYRYSQFTEVVDGIEWRYVVENGTASVGNGSHSGSGVPANYGNTAIPKETAGEIAIPAVLGGFPVRVVSDYAFEGCFSLTSIVIPEGVTIVGQGAFQTDGLDSISIPDSLTTIGPRAFYKCFVPVVYVPPGVRTLDAAFSGQLSWRNGTNTTVHLPRWFEGRTDGFGLGGHTVVFYDVDVDFAFDRQGGTGGTTNAVVLSGDDLPRVVPPVREGHSFAGYFGEPGCGGEMYYFPNGTGRRTCDFPPGTTLYAGWEPNVYEVLLDCADGGTTNSVFATFDSPLPAIEVPRRFGHSFKGFFEAPGGTGTQYYTASGVSARVWDVADDAVLHAFWTPNRHRVALAREGGIGGTTEIEAVFGRTFPTVVPPVRTGYSFGGYHDEPEGEGIRYCNAAGAGVRDWDKDEDTTLHAAWTANSYVVTFSPAGGEGGDASVTATFGSGMPAISVPGRPGHLFSGYYSAPDGRGTRYYDSTGTSVRVWNVADDAVLYACWEEVPTHPVHRFYSKNYKGHFFTINEGEKDDLVANNPNWKYEGTDYRAFENQAPETVALHRFYSKNYRGHFFTVNEGEKNDLIANNPNWKYEGVAYYVYPQEVEGAVPVYRFWSKNYRHHFYTTNEGEKNDLIARNPNWAYEGVAFWALPDVPLQTNVSCRDSGDGRTGAGTEPADDPGRAGTRPTGWALVADGAEIAIPGVTEVGDFLVETRAEAPDADELAGDDPAIRNPDNPASGGADGPALHLTLPDGVFGATLWSAADGTVAEDADAEGAFGFELPANGVWHWLRVVPEAPEDPVVQDFSLWLRAK